MKYIFQILPPVYLFGKFIFILLVPHLYRGAYFICLLHMRCHLGWIIASYVTWLKFHLPHMSLGFCIILSSFPQIIFYFPHMSLDLYFICLIFHQEQYTVQSELYPLIQLPCNYLHLLLLVIFKKNVHQLMIFFIFRSKLIVPFN